VLQSHSFFPSFPSLRCRLRRLCFSAEDDDSEDEDELEDDEERRRLRLVSVAVFFLSFFSSCHSSFFFSLREREARNSVSWAPDDGSESSNR